jgi:hypothetical protein
MSKRVDETDAAAYVAKAMRGRLEDLGDLIALSTGDAEYSVSDERAEELGIDHGDYVGDQALDRLGEYPLCVEATMTFEIVLGTGGPDDRLLVECDSYDESRIGADGSITSVQYEIRCILYRYSWSGSAERVLSGEDFDTAEQFARQVVSELVE